jgi:hypothetical protein
MNTGMAGITMDITITTTVPQKKRALSRGDAWAGRHCW